MKKISKTLVVVVLLTVIAGKSLLVFCQTGNFTRSELKSKTWVMNGSTDLQFDQVFKNSRIIYTMAERNRKAHFNEEYYLSDSADTVFDISKINKIQKGRYLVSRALLKNKNNLASPLPVSVFEIKELTDSSLILKDTRRKENIFGYTAKK
jgi:hypothetical protein